MEPRLDYKKASPEAYKAMAHVEAVVRNSGLDAMLLELVKIRASQLNGCAFCIDMHTKDARAKGETEQRLYALNAWRETPFFTGKQRDTESTNDYFGARYYASNIAGRWLTPDPSMEGEILELPQTWNKYSYEYNRPLYGTDPDGRCPPCIGAVVGGVVEGGFDLGTQLYLNKENLSGVSWSEVGANALGGAVAGALAGATGGASLVADAVAGSAANVIGSAVTRAAEGESPDKISSADTVSQDALAGFVGGAAGHVAADMVHVPEEPTRPGGHGRAQTSSYNARMARYYRASINQAVRQGIASSLATHGTKGVMDKMQESLFLNSFDYLNADPGSVTPGKYYQGET